jgi:hypothetical protein
MFGGQVDDLSLVVQVDVPVATGDCFYVSLDQVLQGGQVRVEGFDANWLTEAGGDNQGGASRAHGLCPYHRISFGCEPHAFSVGRGPAVRLPG